MSDEHHKPPRCPHCESPWAPKVDRDNIVIRHQALANGRSSGLSDRRCEPFTRTTPGRSGADHFISSNLVIVDGAQFSAGEVSFNGAEFSGGTVSFVGAQFSGGLVDLAMAIGKVTPDALRLPVPPPEGVRLPPEEVTWTYGRLISRGFVGPKAAT